MAGIADKDLDAVVRREKIDLRYDTPPASTDAVLKSLEERIATLESLMAALLSLSSRVENLELELEMTGDSTSRVKRIEARLDRIASRTMLHLRQEHKIAIGANL